MKRLLGHGRVLLTTAILACLAEPGAAAVSCRPQTVPNSGPYQNGGTFQMCVIDPEPFPEALCNDGSVPVFQVQPASPPGSTTWVIWLAGGFQCTDAASCEARATNPKTHSLVTSRGIKAIAGHGLLSHDPALNPALAGANTVLVHYCSSDAWSGGHRAPNGPDGFVPSDPSTWNFEGRAIVKAVVASLHELDLGFLKATRIVLGGSSAGAAGIAYTVNDLLPKLPPGAQVVLVNDAGFVLDVGRFKGTLAAPYEDTTQTTPTRTLFKQGRVLWHGHGDSHCNDLASSAPERLACFDTSVLLQAGYITIPAFVAQSLLDLPELAFQLCPKANGTCGVPHDPSTKRGTYAGYYAQQMAALISGKGASQLPYTAYAPDFYVHTMLNGDAAFIDAQPFGSRSVSPRDAFDAWYADPTQPGHAAVGTGPGVE